MTRTPARIAVALALCLAVPALASCGEEDAQLLPGETAREITSNLDQVRQLSDEGDCAGATAAAEQVALQIEELSEVDRRLKRALEEGADRLGEVIDECDEAAEETAPTVPTEEGEGEEEEQQKEEEEREKEEEEQQQEEEEREKEEEKERKEEEKEEEKEPETPSSDGELPPQSEGEGKGIEEDGSSGGVSPGSPAGGGE